MSDRNWREYNEKLVKRGELLISLDFLDSWDEELKEMDVKKRGRPYEFPEKFIQQPSCMCSFFHTDRWRAF
ncbi:MAG: hypothetical protein SVE93_06115 [Candidatus Thermoplasmatota archaeon]|nr:hypothetical protein [Candidatus Thermoplasmatota archaeon]